MLKIENYHKLCNKRIGTDGWFVSYCAESSLWYEIKLDHPHLSSVKVRLSRKPEKLPNGRMIYRFLDTNGKATFDAATADWIGDMDNMIKKLKGFVKRYGNDNKHT